MKDLRVIWVLPHRDQSGDEDVLEDGQKRKLSEAIPVERLPQELVIGVPEAVLEKYQDEDLIFAQYCRQKDQHRSIFSLSVKCGADKSGRTVFLTLLEILPLGGSPEELPVATGLPEEEEATRGRLAVRRKEKGDTWWKSVDEMLHAVRHKPWVSSFANVSVPRALFPPQWPPEKKKSAPDGL